MNCLLLYVIILEKDVASTFASSSVCVVERRNICNNSHKVLNTSTEGALVVFENITTLDVFEMDTVQVIISNPHHKNIEVDQVYMTKKNFKSVMKDYTIREKFQMRSERSSKK